MDKLGKEEYRSIVNGIQDGYFEVDLAGTYTYANKALCNIYGYTREELIGVNYRKHTTRENYRKAFKAFNQIYKSGASGKLINYEVFRKDGARRQVE
ncbi:MAG TPA: PAS domain S-box protein, partial [Candidatus Moranbacteria bacterium]|nr:PAS domain S-box protein [Candidatus Moranbacteria bacterium]